MRTTSIEVAPDEWGGWKVSLVHNTGNTTVLQRTRLKRTAVKAGRAIAQSMECELRVKNRRGQYTTQAASYGNDPRRSKG